MLAVLVVLGILALAAAVSSERAWHSEARNRRRLMRDQTPKVVINWQIPAGRGKEG